jgi:hypothetical protein
LLPAEAVGQNDGLQTNDERAVVNASRSHLFASSVPVSLQRLQTALRQPYPAATARVLADLVEHLHPASPLGPPQQQ